MVRLGKGIKDAVWGDTTTIRRTLSTVRSGRDRLGQMRQDMKGQVSDTMQSNVGKRGNEKNRGQAPVVVVSPEKPTLSGDRAGKDNVSQSPCHHRP